MHQPPSQLLRQKICACNPHDGAIASSARIVTGSQGLSVEVLPMAGLQQRKDQVDNALSFKSQYW